MIPEPTIQIPILEKNNLLINFKILACLCVRYKITHIHTYTKASAINYKVPTNKN